MRPPPQVVRVVPPELVVMAQLEMTAVVLAPSEVTAVVSTSGTRGNSGVFGGGVTTVSRYDLMRS